jgi:nicotinamide-nucleotide amidase
MIGLLITGNEVLWGKILDTNAGFLASELRKHGLLVRRTLQCGDSLQEMDHALTFLLDSCDTVIVTGGLGPTLDDLTLEAIGAFFGRDLHFSQEAWDFCKSCFSRLGRSDIPECNRKQALVPKGATLLPNPYGTASGILLQESWKGRTVRLFALPGVPNEMRPMFLDHVLPRLTPSIMLRSHAWQIFLVGESAIQDSLAKLEEELVRVVPGIMISYQAHVGYVTWRLAVPVSLSTSEEMLHHLLSEMIRPHLQASFGRRVIYEGEEHLSEHLVRTLHEKRLRLSLAESCTGGLIAREITRVPNASRVFMGGAVVYSNESKADLLGVNPRSIERFGAVSVEVAAQLATGSCHAFSTELAVGVTGVAGPGGGTPAHPVGTVCFGLCLPRERVLDEDRLVDTLSLFGWIPTEDLHHFDYEPSHRNIDFVAERRFGAGLTREDIQHRAMNFALGSIAGIMNEIGG